MEVVVDDKLEQPMPATAAAVQIARGLANVDRLPSEVQAAVTALLEAALEGTVGAKRELPAGVIRALDLATALQKVPQPGTGAFA